MHFFSHSSRRRGFSLVELLVCIAIIAIISGVVLARYRSFDSTILLRNLAYEIALSTREAQVLGVSVRGDLGTGFQDAYGMHFTPGTTYRLFRDVNDNDVYDPPTDIDISVYTIGQNNQIRDLCAGTNCSRTSIDVVFRRPDPDALFSITPFAGTPSAVAIVVGPPDGSTTRTVRIWTTGQIAVDP